ncbi:hypothetical protein AB0H73_14935 [Streptomyces olivoreticuli]
MQTQSRQTRHALTALAHSTPGRRRVIAWHAEQYLAQVERRRLPVGYCCPIPSDRLNRADAYRMRGSVFARMLGISCRRDDADLPDTARAVLAAIGETELRLEQAAVASGQPALVAILWLATAVRDDPKSTAPKPEILKTVPASGGLPGYDHLAIAPGAPLPDGRTIATVEDPLGSAWLVTDDRGAVHWLHKYGELQRDTDGGVAFIEPEWAGWSSD